MKQIEINLNVLIHKVKLHVRFPCSLIANIKIQNTETAIGPQVPLRVGEAYLQMSTSQKMSLFYESNKSTFIEKKIALCIYLNTSSGRIPAGAAYIFMNSLKKGLNKLSLSIDKCPDKSAYIEASINYEILSQTETTGAENIPESVVGKEPFTLREPMQNRQAKSIQKNNFRANERTGLNSPKQSNATQLKLSIKSLERSKVEGYRSNFALKAETEDRAESAHKTGDVSDREEYINQSPGRMIDYSAKLRMAELQKELKNFQKKYEQSALQLKSVIAKKDLLERSLKQSQGQARIFKQKYEDLQQSTDNALKRNDYKQNSYKEQIKSLTDKLSTSENEKQLMIFEKNDLVNDFEEREKTLRLSIKQKQRQFNEEKNKLIKKNENLAKELLQLQAKIAESDKKLLESVKQGNEECKKNQLLQEKCQQLLDQINELKETLVLQKSKRAEVEENLGSNLELEQEKKKLKKKIAEQQQEMGRLNKNIAQIDSNYQKMVKKTQEVEITLKQKINLLKNLQKQYDGSVKQNESLKKALQDKQRKLEQALSLKQGQSSKLESLTDQLRQSQKKNLQETKNLKKQIQEKERKIQALLKENEDNVESINDYNTKLEKQQVDIQTFKDKINTLKIENGELLHQKQKLQLELGQLKDHFSEEKLNKEELESALRKQLREKESELKDVEEILKKCQNSSQHRQQQDAFKIVNLQQKITNLEIDINDYSSQIQGLKDTIKQLQLEKYHGQSLSDELQYNLKLKNNQITFLKENAEKNNQEISDLTKQNKEMSIKVQKLEDKVFEFQNITENLNHQLNEATQNGSGIQQKLANYIKLNNQRISLFLNAFLSGSKITLKPIHQQTELQILMQSVITKVNEFYTKYEEQIKQRQTQLQATIVQREQLNQKLIAALKQNQALHGDLQETLNKNRQSNKNADSVISDLRRQLSDARYQISTKYIQISQLNVANLSLTQELDSLHNGFGNKQEQNSALKLRIRDLQETLNKKEKEYLSNESRLNKKYEDDSNNFKLKIGELQENSKKQTAKLTDCTNKLNEKIKENKELQRKTNEEIKRLKTEIERLTVQVSKQMKQLQSKSNLNTRYSQIEAQLKAKLEQAAKDNAALRELNENIRKRNQKAAQRQKEQDALIFSLKGGQTQLASKQSDLQKAIKERTAEYVASREQNFKLQKEKQKLIQDLQIANSMLKVKEDYQKKIQTSLKNIEQEKVGLKETIKSLELAANEISRKSQKQISVLNETKNKFDKQFEETKQKLQATQAQLAKESTTNQQANKQLTDEIKELKLKNKQLEDERSSALKSLQEQERTHSAEDAYLKPIRDHLQSLKGHMAEYSRTSDQFQSNKNKLLKLATTKAELPNEKYVSERIRDFSNAYNKLKTFILGCKLSEQSKLQAAQEIKKVQTALDKVLRGDK